MKFKNILAAVLVLGSVVTITSCDKTESDEFEYVAPAGKLAGEWFVTLKDGGASVLTGERPYAKLVTFNDANKGDSLWVQSVNLGYADAAGNSKPVRFGTKAIKVKSIADPNALTFSIAQGKNIATGTVAPKITILNSKILKGQGKSLSGNKVDSIYIEVQYSDTPGKTFILSGHQRTGFGEDEPQY